MRRIRLFLKSRRSLANGPCRALSLLPIATRPSLRGKARTAFRAGFLGLTSLGRSTLVQIVEANERDRRRRRRDARGATGRAFRCARSCGRPARRRGRDQILRRRSAIIRRACSSPSPEATRTERSAKYSARCVRATGPGMHALSSFWRWLATMMCRSSTSISPGLAKERAGECVARLLALLRSPFARPRRRRQLARHRRIPESLSGAPGACAAAGGMRRGTRTAPLHCCAIHGSPSRPRSLPPSPTRTRAKIGR